MIVAVIDSFQVRGGGIPAPSRPFCTIPGRFNPKTSPPRAPISPSRPERAPKSSGHLQRSIPSCRRFPGISWRADFPGQSMLISPDEPLALASRWLCPAAPGRNFCRENPKIAAGAPLECRGRLWNAAGSSGVAGLERDVPITPGPAAFPGILPFPGRECCASGFSLGWEAGAGGGPSPDIPKSKGFGASRSVSFPFPPCCRRLGPSWDSPGAALRDPEGIQRVLWDPEGPGGSRGGWDPEGGDPEGPVGCRGGWNPEDPGHEEQGSRD